ncbi:MAG: metallophosphoesterase family protein [Bacteroidota bacterium]|jgi:putative phosphoesterase
MKKIGLLSDSHGFIPPQLYDFFVDCDELWHAGDWGNVQTYDQLSAFKPIKGVWGNIDGQELRLSMKETLVFQIEEVKVLIHHIIGHPQKYNARAEELIRQHQPDLLVCGHSHILKVMRDEKHHLMYFNPGACGIKGFHQKSTALRFKIEGKRLFDLEVWEISRSSLSPFFEG